MVINMTVEEFFDKLGSSLWAFTRGTFDSSLECLVEAPITFGGGAVCTTTAMRFGYDPFVTSTEAAEIVGDWTSSMDERTATGLGIISTGGTTTGIFVEPEEPGGSGGSGGYVVKDRNGKVIGSIHKESRTNISRVERNAEKVYRNFYKNSVKTSTPIIMADDPVTYNAADEFLKKRSPGMVLRMLTVLDMVLTNEKDDTLFQ